MNVSASDRDLITRTVLAEAGPNASPDEQAAVAHVVLNRLGRGDYPKTVSDVLFQKNAFEPWGLNRSAPNNPMRFSPDSPAYAKAAGVVDGVLGGSIPDPTGGADRFQQPDIVATRVKKGQVPAASEAPQNAQRIGSQVFWSTPSPQGEKAMGKPTADDYGDLLGEPAQPQPTQTAGPAVPSTAAGAVKAKDYADLMEDPAEAPPASNGVSSVTGQKGDFSGLFGELGPQIRAHPYIAGGLAAAGAVPLLAGGGEIAIPIAGLLGRMATSRAGQYALGTALGSSAGALPDVWHYLMHLTGMTSEAP